MRKILPLVGVVLLVAIILIYAADSREPEGNGNGDGTQSSSAVSSVSGTNGEPAAATKELACGDAIDNDSDTLIDCDDPDCAGSDACRCSALSCGEGGAEATCRRENGCFCDDEIGCRACRRAEQTCETSADCCLGSNLDCKQVTLASGSTEKRCLPAEASVCSITCSADGQWETPVRCSNQVIPPGAEQCRTLVGECDPSVNAERNERNCWQ